MSTLCQSCKYEQAGGAYDPRATKFFCKARHICSKTGNNIGRPPSSTKPRKPEKEAETGGYSNSADNLIKEEAKEEEKNAKPGRYSAAKKSVAKQSDREENIAINQETLQLKQQYDDLRDPEVRLQMLQSLASPRRSSPIYNIDESFNPRRRLGVNSSNSSSSSNNPFPSRSGVGNNVIKGGLSSNRSRPLSRFGGCYDCSTAQDPSKMLASNSSPFVISRRGGINNNSNTNADIRDHRGGHPPPLLRPACQRCGNIFNDTASLELHHFTKHAVRELKPGDSSRNVVEIIFRTSWFNKAPDLLINVPASPSVMKPLLIERVFKIHNLARLLAKFEAYREAVKLRASKLPLSKKHSPRCLADGNELLRFYATSLACSFTNEKTEGQLLTNPASPLTPSSRASLDRNSDQHHENYGLPVFRKKDENGELEREEGGLCHLRSCHACRIIRSGFSKVASPLGIYTAASSGRAHSFSSKALETLSCNDKSGIINRSDYKMLPPTKSTKSAMIVCRVIAGRVQYKPNISNTKDSPGGSNNNNNVAMSVNPPLGFDSTEPFSNGEDLYVSNPAAILPCFLVIYHC